MDNLYKTPTEVVFNVIGANEFNLKIIESGNDFKFLAKRQYILSTKKQERKRGYHAHKKLLQIMVCLSGRAKIKFRGLGGDFVFELASDKNIGVFVPPGYWREIELDSNTVLSVLASDVYNESDYIRDYEEFKSWLAENRRVKKVPFVALDRCHEELKYDLERIASEAISSNQLILGKSCDDFERKFSKYCESSFAIGCGNGFDALALALKALNIGEGDEVIVPTNSFIATALAVSQVGATPVFADCNNKTYGIEINSIINNLTEKTRAIIAVHLYGIPADMDPIIDLAKTHDLLVIEDAAQAHGARYKGRRIGGIGHAAAFSFYPTKNLGALGDGGAVVTNDETLANKVRMLANYGSIEKYNHEILGVNSRLDSIQAEFLKLKLEHLDKWNVRRQQIAQIYMRELAELEDDIQLPIVDETVDPVWHLFPIVIKRKNRNEIKKILEKNNVECGLHYPYCIHKTPGYNIKTFTPNSEILSDSQLSLPMDPFLTDEEIYFAIDAIKEIFKKF